MSKTKPSINKVIGPFVGNYVFLSNFSYSRITYKGMTYPTVENFFQAMKSKDLSYRKELTQCSPTEAKRLGREVELRKDWESIKVEVMTKAIKLKFKNPALRKLLLETKNAQIVEYNSWNDLYWGRSYKGVGKNMLGKLLMRERKRIRELEEETCLKT